MKKALYLCVVSFLFTALTFAQDNTKNYTITRLGDNYVIQNDTDPLDTWDAKIQSDGSVKYINRQNVLESWTETVNFDGSTTISNDYNILNSFTSRRQYDGSIKTTNDQDPFDTYTTKENYDGSYTTEQDYNPSNTQNYYNNEAMSSNLPEIKAKQYDYGAYSNPQPVRVNEELRRENEEAYAAAGALLATATLKWGTGLVVYGGFYSEGSHLGIDILFNRLLLGVTTAGYNIGTSETQIGSITYTDPLNRNYTVMNLGFSPIKKNKNTYLKFSYGEWWNDDFEDEGAYYKVGIIHMLGKKETRGITTEIFYSTFGVGGSVGYTIPFNRGEKKNR